MDKNNTHDLTIIDKNELDKFNINYNDFDVVYETKHRYTLKTNITYLLEPLKDGMNKVIIADLDEDEQRRINLNGDSKDFWTLTANGRFFDANNIEKTFFNKDIYLNSVFKSELDKYIKENKTLKNTLLVVLVHPIDTSKSGRKYKNVSLRVLKKK